MSKHHCVPGVRVYESYGANEFNIAITVYIAYNIIIVSFYLSHFVEINVLLLLGDKRARGVARRGAELQKLVRRRQCHRWRERRSRRKTVEKSRMDAARKREKLSTAKWYRRSFPG